MRVVSAAMVISLLGGVALGLVAVLVTAVAWVVASLRERSRAEVGLRDREGAARASAAEAQELRRQLAEANGRTREVEDDLSAAIARQAAAEARAAEAERHLAQQKQLVEQADVRLRDSFRSLAAEALARNNEGFLTLATQALGAAKAESTQDLAARQAAIAAIVTPVRESLDKVDEKIAALERERGQAFGRLSEQVRALTSTQERLEAETSNLVRALRAPAVRGRWGEVQLKRVVELAGMLEHCDFGQQVTLVGEQGRSRPDLVVRMPGGRHVVVDAKVPLEAYLDATEAPNDDERRARLRVHAAQVRGHVLKLGSKSYWAELGGTPEFVVLFLPGESFYSAALEVQPGLIEEGVAHRVLIATPTTLIALLQAVHYGWREERIAANAQEISEQGRVLHERVAKLAEHWSKLGAALGRAAEHFNDATGSLESRVLPAARKLEELGARGRKPLPDTARIDVRPRLLSMVRHAAAANDDESAGEGEGAALAADCV